MDDILLTQPEEKHAEAVMEYREEFIVNGELPIHGAPLLEEFADYSDWLRLARNDFSVSPLAEGWVDATTLLAIRKANGQLLGIINIRHELNDFLRTYGGTIGFSVRPEERRRGYATKMLTCALGYCRDLGLREVLLSCHTDNEASRKTILACGGELDHEGIFTDGLPMQMYRISM